MANSARRSHTPLPTLLGNREPGPIEPYPGHAENPQKLQAHLNAVFMVGARLLKSALDAAFVDASAVVENTDYFQTELARDTAVLPHCENSIKFYSSLGMKEPDAFHRTVVKFVHQNLKNSLNQFFAKKTIRSGKKFEHFVQKHLNELQDSSHFDRQVTAPTPSYKKAPVAAPTARPSLLPPVRPPTNHTIPVPAEDERYAGMPELRCYKPPLDDSWEGEERPPLQKMSLYGEGAEDDDLPPLGEPIANHHDEAKLMRKLRVARAERNMKKVHKYEKKLSERGMMANEFEGMPALKIRDDTVGMDIALFREAYYGAKKRHAQRNGDREAEKKYAAKEKALMDKKNKSNAAEAERRRENKEADEEYRETREIKSKAATPRPATPLQDKIDPNEPAEALKSVKWLRECSTATDAQAIKLIPKKTYVFFAPSDNMIDRLLEKFSSGSDVLSKERVISAHLAEKKDASTTSFQTFVGVNVQKEGSKILLPKVRNPEIVGAKGGKVSSIIVGGATVVILPQDNLFPVQKK